jgi:O-antigen/teichoic acid export membrane protein
MSLKSNIAANYVSQIYTTLIGIAMVPFFFEYMGSEAYGLVGFFAMLQTWFNLLDLGLTPTIARESARYHGGAMSAVEYRRLFQSLSIVFICIALIGGAILFLEAGPISKNWLNAKILAPAAILVSVRIMAVCVALRWIGGLYRGVITGAERLVWLSAFNATIATLRFGGVVVVMSIWGYTPHVFFWYQLAVAALELGVLKLKCHFLLAGTRYLDEPIEWSFKPILPLMRFSLTIAFTSSVWVLVTQTDKLVLSGILPLAQYGYFTLAVLVAGGITMVTAPVSTALLPRLARLHAEGNNYEVRRLYNQASQLVSVIAGSLAVTMTVCSKSLLFTWTGSLEISESAAPILRLYAIGNGLLALGAFPFYLQYARGNLHYHVIGNAVMMVVLIPAIIVAAIKAGGIGAGWVWVVMNALYLAVWVSYVHSKLEPGLHLKWLIRNVLAVLIPTLLVGLLFGLTQPDLVESRVVELFHTAIVAISCLLVAILASPVVRSAVPRVLRSVAR